MAITFISGEFSGVATTTSVTLSDAGAEGDLMLAIIKVRDTAGAFTITDPTDWTQIDQFHELTGSADDTIYVGYKIRGADAGDGYVWDSWAANASSGAMIVLRGVDTTTPIDTTYVKASHYVATADTPNHTPKPIDTTTDGAWVCLLRAGTVALSTDSDGSPSGYTERAHPSDITGTNQYTAIWTKEVATAGTETVGAFTYTSPGSSDDPRTFTIAIRPASTQSPVPILSIHYMES